MVGVEQQQQRVADDRLAALVHVADQVAGQAHPQAPDEAGVPGLVGHLLAGGLEPGNVLDVGAADAAAQEELAALEDRLLAPDARHLAHEVQEALAARRSAPS